MASKKEKSIGGIAEKPKKLLELEDGTLIDQEDQGERLYQSYKGTCERNRPTTTGDLKAAKIPREFWSRIIEDLELSKEDFYEGEEEVPKEPEPTLTEFITINYNKKGDETSRQVDIDAVADYIEKRFDVRTIYGIREETLEVYDAGVWSVTGAGIIKSEIERLLGVYCKNNVVNEILEKIKRRTETSREEADKIPEYKRCLENGVLSLDDVDDIKFLEHSKDYNFRNKFPIDYDTKATCPKIIEFMKETFFEEDLPKIQEWFGFHLVRRYFLKRALLLHGPKNTSKTVVLNLLTFFLGGNVSGLSLQEISRGKPFDLLVLKGKDANICDDLSSSDMKAIGGFKMVVGDGFISGEHKFGDKDRFRNTAKDTNACNRIPSPGEDLDDDAYYERILLIPMDHVIPKEKQDRKLIDKLTTPGELSGLLNWAIEGYIRLVKQNSFSNEKSPEETKFLMVQKGESLAKFSSEVLEQEDGSKVTKDEMYIAYCSWCRNHKPQLSPDSKDKIGKTLSRFASYIHASSDGSKRYWLNVKLRVGYDTYYSSQNNIYNISNKVNSSSDNNIYGFSEPVIPVIKNQEDKSQFTESEIKKAGYTLEELKEMQGVEKSEE